MEEAKMDVLGDVQEGVLWDVQEGVLGDVQGGVLGDVLDVYDGLLHTDVRARDTIDEKDPLLREVYTSECALLVQVFELLDYMKRDASMGTPFKPILGSSATRDVSSMKKVLEGVRTGAISSPSLSKTTRSEEFSSTKFELLWDDASFFPDFSRQLLALIRAMKIGLVYVDETQESFSKHIPVNWSEIFIDQRRYLVNGRKICRSHLHTFMKLPSQLRKALREHRKTGGGEPLQVLEFPFVPPVWNIESFEKTFTMMHTILSLMYDINTGIRTMRVFVIRQRRLLYPDEWPLVLQEMLMWLSTSIVSLETLLKDLPGVHDIMEFKPYGHFTLKQCLKVLVTRATLAPEVPVEIHQIYDELMPR